VKVPHGLTDEIILARYVKGFFGGYVFTPESIILKALRLDFTSFIGEQTAHSVASSIKLTTISFEGYRDPFANMVAIASLGYQVATTSLDVIWSFPGGRLQYC
jgi:hypothetical protein